MKHLVALSLGIVFFSAPAVLALDNALCSVSGFSVIYINGINTTREQADADRRSLGEKFQSRGGDPSIQFLTGYNQTHLGGLGDKLKSVAQTYLSDDGRHLNDFDLKTILMETSSLITTQKILLVGHSQGTFYTNAMYDYLIAQGYPPSSIAVYNLATPASTVAGNGLYLTSSYDRLINYVRELNAMANAPQALHANINIPIPYFEKDDEWGGHHFESDYLDGAPGQIVADIEEMLAQLKPWEKPATGACFSGPTPNVAYRAQELAFATLDTTTRVAKDTGGAVASAAQALQSAAGNTLASAWYSVVPPASYDTAAGAMGAMYRVLTPTPPNYILELTADAKAIAAAKAAREAAEEEARRNAPRIEAWRPKAYVAPAAQAGAAAFALAPEVAEAAQVVPLATELPAIIPGPAGNPYQPGYGGSGHCTDNCPNQSSSSGVPAAASVPSAPLVESAPPPTPEPTPAPVPEPVPEPEPTPAPAAPTSLACTASLIAGECIVPSTSATITWPDADNVESYDIYRDGAWFANTTATTAPVTLTSGATSTFEVIGLGLIGMRATSSPLSIHSLGASLRINEIAWSGTVGNPNDQWIEVRNMAGRAIDMSRVALASETSGAYLPLTGILAGNDGVYSGYYLIERREQATNVTADLVSVFALLAQTGEELKLVWHDGTATTTIDTTPPVAVCGGWCAGRAAHAIGTSIQSLPNVWALESMERIGSDGALAGSWQHNDAYNLTARDFSNDGINGLIYGTPRLPNSQGWPAQGWYCGALVSGTPEFDTPQGCILLLRFMSPRVDRYVGQFIGTIGSSTLSAMNSAGKVSQYDVTLDGAGMNAGDAAFVAVWENRTNVGSDVQNFQNYFTGAATSGPPHTNYAVFEWRKR